MPSHIPTTMLGSHTGLSGLSVNAVPAGTILIVIRTTTLPPMAHKDPGEFEGPIYGVGHYNIRRNGLPTVGFTAILAGGPIRYVDHGIECEGNHYSTLRVFEQAGGIYEVWFFG